jgi:preprotein translocase subunit SecA
VQTAPAPTSLPGVKDARTATMTPTLNVKGLEAPQQPSTLRFSAPSDSGEVTTQVRRTGTASADGQDEKAEKSTAGSRGGASSSKGRKRRR